jgi:hypothetical protein
LQESNCLLIDLNKIPEEPKKVERTKANDSLFIDLSQIADDRNIGEIIHNWHQEFENNDKPSEWVEKKKQKTDSNKSKNPK